MEDRRNDAERLLNAAMDFIASTLEQPSDPRAWDHLLIYCPRDAIERRYKRINDKDEPTIDPTSRGDLIAAEVRRWYEANRETWWDRHSPFGAGPDRSGAHADEFMLGLIRAVAEASARIPR